MGNYIRIIKRPEYDSVEECKTAMRKHAPTLGMEDLIDMDDIVCDCCSKQAPYLAAAIMNVEDTTPTTVAIQQNTDHKIEMCANCFTYGARPKSVKFGNIQWNKEALKVQSMAESNTGVQW